MAVSKVASFKTNVFRIANISEADTLVNVKAVYLVYAKTKQVNFME